MLIWLLAQQRADRADHAGHVAIAQHQEISLRHRLDAEPVDANQAQDAGAEDGALHARRARRRVFTVTLSVLTKSVSRRDMGFLDRTPRSRAMKGALT